jgi:hypothetical protein
VMIHNPGKVCKYPMVIVLFFAGLA